MEEVIDQTIATEQTSGECLSHEEEDIKVIIPINEGMLKHENQDNECLENISTVEHDYILQQECVLSNANEQEQEQQQQHHHHHHHHHHHYQHQLTPGESFQREDYTEYVNLLVKAADATIKQDEAKDEEEKLDITNTDIQQPEADSQYQNETRRSKRKLVRRNCETKRDSDEENYFENLNLSSRLKKDQSSDQSEKIFLCYLCDKEFLSKNVLKEHMHSHEEVRKVLSLKRTPDTPQKDSCNVAKSPPSGKRSNKCPYCGKQYIYITSFSKHLKKHEREKEEGKEESMPLEISFHEDEHSLDLDDYKDARRNLNTEYRKKVKQRQMGHGEDHEEEEQEIRGVKDCGDGNGEGRGRGRGRGSEGREGNNNNNEDDVNDDTDDDNDEYDDDYENGKRLSNSNSKEEQESLCTVRTETFACDKCTKKFSTKRNLRKHSISHTVLNCSICEDEFDSLEKLRNHRAKHVVEGVLTEQELEMDKEYAIKKETLGYETENKENDHGVKDEPMAGLLEMENNSSKKNDR